MASEWHLGPRGVLQLVFVLCATQAACYIAAPPIHAYVRQGGPVARSTPARSLLQTCTHLRSNPLGLRQHLAPTTAVRALSTERDVEQSTAARNYGGMVPFDPVDTQTRIRPQDGKRPMSDEDSIAMQAAKSADLGMRYDPDVASAEFSGRTIDVWRRDLQISVPLTSFLGQVLIDFQRGVEIENRPLRAKQFMEIIAGLGPAFIKAGQALSSRPDLLPPEYLQELQKLQDRLPPFPNDVAFKIIEEQLGKPIRWKL